MSAADTTKANQIVLTSLAVTGTLAVLKKVTTGGAPDVVRVLVGVFIAGGMLTLTAEWLPDVARSLAVLLLVASLLYAGPDVWGAVTNRARAKASATGALAKPSTGSVLV